MVSLAIWIVSLVIVLLAAWFVVSMMFTAVMWVLDWQPKNQCKRWKQPREIKE